MSVVIENRCKRLNHLDQNGTVEGVWFPNARRVVTNPPGVEQAANGSIVCAYGIWEVLHRFTPELNRWFSGRENARVRAGWRRRRSSQMTPCNGAYTVKVRQGAAMTQRREWRKECPPLHPNRSQQTSQGNADVGGCEIQLAGASLTRVLHCPHYNMADRKSVV